MYIPIPIPNTRKSSKYIYIYVWRVACTPCFLVFVCNTYFLYCFSPKFVVCLYLHTHYNMVLGELCWIKYVHIDTVGHFLKSMCWESVFCFFSVSLILIMYFCIHLTRTRSSIDFGCTYPSFYITIPCLLQ